MLLLLLLNLHFTLARYWPLETETVCQGVYQVYDTQGIIVTPTIDKLYAADTSCLWIIEGAAGSIVKLSFSYFQTECGCTLAN